MSNTSLHRMTITEVAPMIESGEVSPVEVVKAAVEQAERLQPALKGFITLRAEAALEEAAERERAIANGGYRGPLDGIPVGLKDNIATEGLLTTVGSRVFADHVPDYDAFAVERLKSAGAIILGKENLHEFAGGVPCDNPYYGSVSNPWNTDYVAGGSSGGSGGERRGLHHVRVAGHRPGRLRPHPVRHVRHRGYEAVVWTGQPARPPCYQLQRRPHSADDPQRARQRPRPAGHSRQRPAGPELCARSCGRTSAPSLDAI